MQMQKSPVDRTLAFLRNAARRANDDRGPLRTIGEVKQAIGADKEAVRGYLIKLVARGDILLHDWSGGQCWEAVMPKKVAPVEVADGHFILQRELLDGNRSSWFDAETFTNFARAKQALEFAKSAELARSQEFFGRRAQRIRLLSVPMGA
ncbi:hypothetical protein [Sphingobium cupriresistens]|uniref:hypothetical protein n=1 Tax=Sphingobium cupriresistens TaxID=1132417 RepID=UPI0011DF3A21|nr:hypothetical protein [Sphingobium cupriresistens]